MRHQRQRILTGAAKAIAARGYRDTSVADIVKAAHIARARFYENFGSKEDCFLALYDAATAEALEIVTGACERAEGEFPGRVQTGIEALLAHLESDPALARACIVEGPAAGPAIGDLFERMLGGFAAQLRQGRAGTEVAELADTVEETVVGGVYWLLYYALLDDKKARLAPMVLQLTEFSLIPFIGAEAARAGTT